MLVVQKNKTISYLVIYERLKVEDEMSKLKKKSRKNKDSMAKTTQKKITVRTISN